VRVLAALALALIALAFVVTWAYGNPYSDDACLDALAPEGSAYHTEAALWPPGGECVTELPGGGERVESGPVPWFEWIFLALCTGAVLTVTWAWGRVRRAARASS
jgi:hypothetical protein